MQSVNCKLIGDRTVGKTNLLTSYITDEFHSEYKPSFLDNSAVTITISGIPYILCLFDTEGRDRYNRLQTLIYTETHVFLVCFSVVDPASFKNVKEKWIPEIRRRFPYTPFLLIGTQTDLREDVRTMIRLAGNQQKPVSRKQGEKMARELKAVKYVECSALTQKGLNNVFNEAILAGLKAKRSAKPGRWNSYSKCILM